IAGPLRIAFERRARVVALAGERRGGELAAGAGGIAVQLPVGVARGAAADDVADGLGVIDRTAEDVRRRVAARRRCVGRGRQHWTTGGGRYPRRAAVVTGVRIEGADQGRRIGGLLIEVIHVRQSVRSVAGGDVARRDRVIIVSTCSIRRGSLHAG